MGEGHKVLFLPGGLCTTEFYADVMAQPAMSEAGLGIGAVTLPGFGRTKPPADLAMESYARLMGEFAGGEGCDVVVGHSLGATALPSRFRPAVRSGFAWSGGAGEFGAAEDEGVAAGELGQEAVGEGLVGEFGELGGERGGGVLAGLRWGGAVPGVWAKGRRRRRGRSGAG